MKKVLMLAMGGAFLGLTSCNTGDGVDSTMTFQVETINIITSNEDGTTTASSGSYYFDLNMTQRMGAVTSKDIILDNMSMDFTTDDESFTTNTYNAYFKDLNASVNGYEVSGSLLATSLFFYPQQYVGNPKFTFDIIAQYNIGDAYTVRSFPKDAVYIGVTNTSYTDSEGVLHKYEKNDNDYPKDPENIVPLLYQVILNPGNSTANIIMYNAKFSDNPREPTKAKITAQGLTAEYDANGITLKGTNIIPMVDEGGKPTEYPNFIFNSINFRTTNNNLTDCIIEYEVAGMYYGTFTGTYIYKEYETNI
ncbi:MAG: hypothetical protein J1E78_02050 [Muribaculaceae bacterium]|nr:hypothetical protein [Muribaculaceae bacterium]